MDFSSILWPCTLVFFAVFSIILLKKFAGLPTATGPDLNVFTYGHECYVVVKALQNEPFFPAFIPFFGLNKVTFLVFVTVFNFIMMALNFKIEYKISALPQAPNNWWKRCSYRILSLFLGILSLSIFLFCEAKFYKHG